MLPHEDPALISREHDPDGTELYSAVLNAEQREGIAKLAQQ
jgi:hypothetical protein